MRKSFDVSQYEAAHRKRTILSVIIIFTLMPATIITGITLLNNRSYMIVSILLLIYTMIPFFMVFEKRKPKAREIVMIAMMAAITVCAHLLFHVTVPIQAGTALVIIAGISMGPEAGFLVGALARFICNFYMGQGPWSPWQMFCWGILGLLAGICFNKVNLDKIKSRNFKVILGPVVCIAFAIIAAYVTYLIWTDDGTFFGWRLYLFGAGGLLLGVVVQRKRLPVDGITLSIFTFLVTFIIYGGVMNVCAMITSSAIPGANDISWSAMRLLYISGVPYDLAHAGGSAVIMFLFGDKIIKKIERIKIKYGMYR